MACDVGQHVTIVYDECNDIIDQFKWYSFPVEIQRLLPLIIAGAQQPIEITAFGSTTCIRETFKRVCVNDTVPGENKNPDNSLQKDVSIKQFMLHF